MRVLGFLLIACIGAMPTSARGGSSDDTAFFQIVGESVQVVRLPISYTLRPLEEDRRWGAKLQFPVSIGFHQFEVDNLFDGMLKEDLGTISGYAGVEFMVRAGERWTLMPYVEMGAGTDLDGGQTAFLYAGGLACVRESKRTKPLYRFGLGVHYDGASLIEGSGNNGYSTAEIGLDVRFPTRRTLGSRQLDWSIYGIRRRFLTELSFDQLNGVKISLNDQNEIGFTLGLDRPWKLWLLKVDRLGIGFRFGEQLNSIRFLFGVPF